MARSVFDPSPVSSLPDEVGSLLVLLPDQLDLRYLQAVGLRQDRDAVLQLELAEDHTHVPSHKQRTVLFLSAMRHFAVDLAESPWRHAYLAIDDPDNNGRLVDQLRRILAGRRIGRLVAVRPGDFRTLRSLEEASRQLGVELELHEDPHFLVDPEDFQDWAEGRKQLVMEHFYRWMRRRLDVLMTPDGQPECGDWNYDKENRRALGSDAPAPPPRRGHAADAITREVISLVERLFPEQPGRTESFAWPVDRAQAKAALAAFIEQRLEYFGDYQDAMKSDQAWLFHSLLAPALNLKLIDPRECIDAAVDAYRAERAPLNAVEGFVRQIIGWREFIRGVYWREGPLYGTRNHLDQHGALPDFYWNADTEMHCVQQAVSQVLEHGYGHHIQRLMVTGNLALVSGIDPAAISDWYLGMYVDAMDWVTLPNIAGMVMYADGGVVGSKPYAASGKYIDRMSDYCKSCPFDPGQRHGEEACPITTFYWDFLDRTRERTAHLGRMRFAFLNLDRLPEDELTAIRAHARALRKSWGMGDAA